MSNNALARISGTALPRAIDETEQKLRVRLAAAFTSRIISAGIATRSITPCAFREPTGS